MLRVQPSENHHYHNIISSFSMVQRDVWGLMCKCGSEVFVR